MLTLIINKIQTLLFSFDSFCLVPKPPRVQSIASCRKVSHHCCFSCRRHRHRAYHSYCHRCNFVVVVGRDYVQSPSFSLLVSVQNFPHHRCQFQVPQLLISLVRVYHFLRACLPFLFCIMVSSCINLIGKPVIVKLKWGMEYKGMVMSQLFYYYFPITLSFQCLIVSSSMIFMYSLCYFIFQVILFPLIPS